MNNNELLARIDALELRVKELEGFQNVNVNKKARENVFGQPRGEADSSISKTISFGAGGGSAQVPDFPDGFLEAIKPNGDRVLLPAYSKSRF